MWMAFSKIPGSMTCRERFTLSQLGLLVGVIARPVPQLGCIKSLCLAGQA